MWVARLTLATCKKSTCSAIFIRKPRLLRSSHSSASQTPVDFSDLDHDSLLQDSQLMPRQNPQVLIIQPKLKSIQWKKLQYIAKAPADGTRYRGPDVEEAIALVDSLEGWKTVGVASFNLRSHQPHPERLFTKGVWDSVTELVCTYRDKGPPSGTVDSTKSPDSTLPTDEENFQPNHKFAQEKATAIFINWPRLTTRQIVTMQRSWSLPIYDRYTLVIRLFGLRAKYQEAKLQAKLAEIGLLRARLPVLFELQQSGDSAHALSVFGRTSGYELDKLLRTYEARLVAQLEEVERRRKAERKNRRDLRRKRQTPLITVVGYTNAGKTSLIRRLSGDLTMTCSPRVFTTLRTTHHRARISSYPVVYPTSEQDEQDEVNTSPSFVPASFGRPGIQVTLLDTIGFMGDLPTTLLAPFRATLEECLDTDLILHVIDVSEPDWESRADYVDRILSQAGVSTVPSGIMTPKHHTDQPTDYASPRVIRIGNKIDRESAYVNETNRNKLDVCISAERALGVNEMAALIEAELTQRLQWIHRTVCVEQGSGILQWLYSNAMVADMTVDPHNSNRLMVLVIFTPSSWSRLKALYTVQPSRQSS
ncbi:unnamed protein product [Calicophoron daubneyi]|uniref:Hflx-type G domain-containing protein n=1 Tax=Calicophoron daubneyi TaxID=300641 RepID=A0AAV2SZ40_CALDB